MLLKLLLSKKSTLANLDLDICFMIRHHILLHSPEQRAAIFHSRLNDRILLPVKVPINIDLCDKTFPSNYERFYYRVCSQRWRHACAVNVGVMHVQF